jgi:hypothetical protein
LRPVSPSKRHPSRLPCLAPNDGRRGLAKMPGRRPVAEPPRPGLSSPSDASRKDRTMQPNLPNFFKSAWLLSLLLTGILTPAPGHAAPFCLQSESIPPQCIYVDAALCARDAAKQGGECTANKNEFRLTPNIGKYCVVTSQLVSLCIYADIDSCQKAATSQHGACVESPGGTGGSGGPNPYNLGGGD